MNTAIRVFALFVAVAGLVSASIAPATTHMLTAPRSMSVTGPGPDDTLPGPIPCQWLGTCFAPTAVAR
ncbi:MAG: hypothetical protein ACLQG3_14955 [Terracidiphilus sp.]